jgi:hypothetical protein
MGRPLPARYTLPRFAPDARGRGVGARIRDPAGTSEFIDEDASPYVESRYREGLTRID